MAEKEKYTCITVEHLVNMLKTTLPNYYVKYFKLVLSDGTTFEVVRNNDTVTIANATEL